MRILAPFAVILLFAGCGQSPPASKTPAGGRETPDSAPSEVVVAPSETTDPGADPGLPGPELPDGPLCDSDADCGADMLCEGVGCGPKQGRCVGKDRMCTRDLAQYCGCDGQTFQSSGSCPGARFAYRGACDAKLEDGEACTDGRQCKSGSCVGEGLEGCSRGAQGVCGSAACTKDLATYCGCNNTEFQGSGSCPNQQFAYRGPCEG